MGSLLDGFDSTSLFLSLVITSVGLAFFMYGRKADRYPQLVGGLLLMVYPYFTSAPLVTFLVGLAIGLGMWAAVWLGW